MNKLRDSSEIPAPHSSWAYVEEAILEHRYEEVMGLISFEEMLEASDGKICRVVKLILQQQPFSDTAKTLVLTFLHGRESLFISPQRVMQLGEVADGTMRAHLLLWQCDTPHHISPKRQEQINIFIFSLFRGIATATSQYINSSVFVKAPRHIRNYLNQLTANLEKELSNSNEESNRQRLINLLSATQTYTQEK